MRRTILCLAGVALLGGCQENLGTPVKGLQSLNVRVVSPDDLGSTESPVKLDEIVIDIEARNEKNEVVAEDLDVDVFLSYGGTKAGVLNACGTNPDQTPLATIRLTAGEALSQKVKLQGAFGKTTLWLQERVPEGGVPRGYGASPEITFPTPTIPEVQTPLDMMSPQATFCTPYNGKQVTIDRATGDGKIVVTSVFVNAYVVADTGANYDPATGKGGFNHMYVFSFGKPAWGIVPGLVLKSVGGNISKFVGFTELNFPYQEMTDPPEIVDLPPVIELTNKERPINTTAKLRLLGLVGATVKTTAKVCPIDVSDDNWKKFNQFLLNYGDGLCDAFSSFTIALPGKVVGTFNPLELNGQTVTITGMLKNSSGQNDAQVLGTGERIACKTTNDCLNKNLDTSKPTCVDGMCKRGAFDFFSIVPRDVNDVPQS